MGLPRPEYWSGLPFPSPGDLPDPGIELRSPAWQEDSLLLSPWGAPFTYTQLLFGNFWGYIIYIIYGLPWWLMVGNLPAVQETLGSGRSPREGNGKSLQYSCLENSMDRGACRMHTVQWVAELDITKQLTLSPCVYLHVHNYFLEISESVLYTYL